MRGKIQISPSTAEVLRSAGKGSWLRPRKDIVDAKGLGKIRTFWLDIEGRLDDFIREDATDSTEEMSNMLSHDFSTRGKSSRLIDWMTEMLSDYLKKVVSKIESTRISMMRRAFKL
jgi:hypothetical protein